MGRSQPGKITSASHPAFLFISRFTFVILFAFILSLTGCSSLHYLLQASHGQLALINHAKPISEVLKDERTPVRVRSLLREIPLIKKFGEEMGLKPTKNYTDYVKLERDAAVWVVSASEPLRFSSVSWSFPIVGSFPYLGWFNRKDAETFASELKQQGLDVDLRGAGAYSTLGWFRDSVLSTMLPDSEESLGDLVNVVIHESVHATVYISGQAYFNESLASFVADELTPVYLEQSRGVDSLEKKAYLCAEKRRSHLEQRLHEAFTALAELYESKKPDSEKLRIKKQTLDQLQKDVKFKREINNATLVQFKTYRTGQSLFSRVFNHCSSDWNRFIKTLASLKPQSFSKPHQENFNPVLEGLNCLAK